MELAHTLIHDVAQLIDVIFLFCRDEQAVKIVLVVASLLHPGLFEILERDILLFRGGQVILILRGPCVGIYLVEHQSSTTRIWSSKSG